MIPEKIIQFIEDHSDEDPKRLLSLVKTTFKDQCTETELPCLCQVIEQVILLYQQNTCVRVTDHMHARLMEALERECKDQLP